MLGKRKKRKNSFQKCCEYLKYKQTNWARNTDIDTAKKERLRKKPYLHNFCKTWWQSLNEDDLSNDINVLIFPKISLRLIGTNDTYKQEQIQSIDIYLPFYLQFDCLVSLSFFGLLILKYIVSFFFRLCELRQFAAVYWFIPPKKKRRSLTKKHVQCVLVTPYVFFFFTFNFFSIRLPKCSIHESEMTCVVPVEANYYPLIRFASRLIRPWMRRCRQDGEKYFVNSTQSYSLW